MCRPLRPRRSICRRSRRPRSTCRRSRRPLSSCHLVRHSDMHISRAVRVCSLADPMGLALQSRHRRLTCLRSPHPRSTCRRSHRHRLEGGRLLPIRFQPPNSVRVRPFAGLGQLPVDSRGGVQLPTRLIRQASIRRRCRGSTLACSGPSRWTTSARARCGPRVVPQPPIARR